MRKPNPPGYVYRGDKLMKIWTDEEKAIIVNNPDKSAAMLHALGLLLDRTPDAISKVRVALNVAMPRNTSDAAIAYKKRREKKRYDKPRDSYIEPEPRYASIFHAAQGVSV